MTQPTDIPTGEGAKARAVAAGAMRLPVSRGSDTLRRLGLSGRTAVIAVPFFWLLLFFLVPFVFVLKISLAEPRIAMPPYTAFFVWADGVWPMIQATWRNFLFLFSDNLYAVAYLNSAKVAAVSTMLCLLIGYPMAYGIARAGTAWRTGLLMLIILPFWTSFLIRVYAWIGILKQNGLINNALMGMGLIDEPLSLIQNDFSLYVGIVYSYLPFMILPLYANLTRLDRTLLEAASDLGARPIKAFLTVTLPLSVPGIVAGALLVFIPAMGEFVIPALLGGPDNLMIGRVLWDEFFSNRDWPVASAVAIALLLLLVVPIMIFQRYQAREAEAS